MQRKAVSVPPRLPGLSCAHTSLQFFRQLQRDGYSGDGLLLIDKALILASKLFACRFQYTGVPFMVHVIGAASILSALRASPHLVAAALIHNAYGNGDFGNARAGATDWKRGEIRRVLGWQVEHYVYEFSVFLRLGRGTFANLPSSIDGLSMTERGVLLLRLADLTEHYRDLGQVYGGRQRAACEMIEKFGAVWTRLAGELAGPTFASQLNRLFEETKDRGTTPRAVRVDRGKGLLLTAAATLSAPYFSRAAPENGPDYGRSKPSHCPVPVFAADSTVRYAQSILELFNQVHRDGYDKSDLQLLRDTYALAVRAFTGLDSPFG